MAMPDEERALSPREHLALLHKHIAIQDRLIRALIRKTAQTDAAIKAIAHHVTPKDAAVVEVSLGTPLATQFPEYVG
jgi:hypothetical protein